MYYIVLLQVITWVVKRMRSLKYDHKPGDVSSILNELHRVFFYYNTECTALSTMNLLIELYRYV